jgi:hypothetical protein
MSVFDKRININDANLEGKNSEIHNLDKKQPIKTKIRLKI